MVSETKKNDYHEFTSLNATYVIKDTNGKRSSFTICGILPMALITDLKTTIHDYIQMSSLILSSSSYSAQSVTMPLSVLKDMVPTNIEDYSEPSNYRGNH